MTNAIDSIQSSPENLRRPAAGESVCAAAAQGLGNAFNPSAGPPRRHALRRLGACALFSALLLSVLTAAVWGVPADAAEPSIQWEKTFGGTGFDHAYSICGTSDGGYIIVGYSGSENGDAVGNHGEEDVLAIKLGADGAPEWKKSLGGSGDDCASSVIQTADGGYVLAGWSDSHDGDVTRNHGGADAWVVKLGAGGELEWQKSLGGSKYEEATSIIGTPDGGYVFAGASSSNDGDA